MMLCFLVLSELQCGQFINHSLAGAINLCIKRFPRVAVMCQKNCIKNNDCDMKLSKFPGQRLKAGTYSCKRLPFPPAFIRNAVSAVHGPAKRLRRRGPFPAEAARSGRGEIFSLRRGRLSFLKPPGVPPGVGLRISRLRKFRLQIRWRESL